MALVCVKSDCSYMHNHGPIREMDIEFCPDCGHKLKEVPDKDFPAIQPVSRGLRFGGVFIDWLLTWPINLLSLVPLLGQDVAAVVIVLFWLFRDINGKSPGKAMVGTMIVSRSGEPATTRQRIMRNIPFAITILPLFIPVVGYVAFLLQGFAFIVEDIMVLAGGERLGDKIAGTMVIKQTSARIGYQARFDVES